MRTNGNNAANPTDPIDGADMIALTRQRLKELDRLRHLGFMQLDRLNEATLALPQDQLLARMTGAKGNMAEYDRFARSIRQITVLEFELRGLFKSPDRDAPRKLRLVKSDRPGFVPPVVLPTLEDLLSDIGVSDMSDANILDIRTDYRRGPLDEVVAEIRQTLGAEPPPDDPFAPVAKAPEPVRPPPRGPEYYMGARPAEPEPVVPQKQPSMKAAELAIMALGGKGFRKPSAKSRSIKHRRNRGPPK